MTIRIFVAFIIFTACIISLFSYLAPHIFSYISPEVPSKALVAFHSFFDITLPVLAFGALIKYLCTFPKD